MRLVDITSENREVIIREIRENDYLSVAKIWRDVLDIPVTDDDLIHTYESMKEDKRYTTYVAESDGTVVGLVTMVTALAIGHPDGYTKINGLGVLPEYRNMGIGRMLLEQAEKVAVQNGTRYLGLASGLMREDAHRFYEHMGYVKTSYWFRKRV
jgi:GNAT superfamily N-acetyltransferase